MGDVGLQEESKMAFLTGFDKIKAFKTFCIIKA